MANKIGLCLGAGGARGIAHVGVLQALEDSGVRVGCVSGCSMGSLVGAMYLSDISPEKMRRMAVALTKDDVLDWALSPFKTKSILRGEKFEEILNEIFGNKSINELSMPYSCIATDLISGEIHTFTEGSVKTAVRASCSIPLAFPPVYLDDMMLVDGGTSERTPVRACRELGAEKVISVDVLSEIPKAEKIKSIFELGFRALDVMGVNIGKYKSADDIADLVIIPPLGGVSQYRVENQQFCFDVGYETAMKYMPKIKALINE